MMANIKWKLLVPQASMSRGWFFWITVILILHVRTSKLCTAVPDNSATPFDPNFCLHSPQVTVCPTPPTFDLVELRAFGGQWYEIGGTARFKLLQHSGMACNRANYSVFTQDSSSRTIGNSSTHSLRYLIPPVSTGGNVSIVNSGIKALGLLGEYGVSQISVVSTAICQDSRAICHLMTITSDLGRALAQLTVTSGALLLLHPAEASQLVVAGTKIGVAVDRINAALDGLSRNVTKIQYINAQLSQGSGGLQQNLHKLSNVTVQAGLVQEAIQGAVKAIAIVRGVVIQVSGKLLVAGGAGAAVTDLGKVTNLLAKTEQGIMELAARIELSLFSINALSTLVAFDPTKPVNSSPIVTSYTGRAVQDRFSAGMLTATIQGKTAPLLILGVDGLAASGYSAALVYSCMEVANSPYQQSLSIISRTRTLDRSVIDQLLNIAKQNGIETTCDDPFLYTVQQSPICFPNIPLPVKAEKGTP